MNITKKAIAIILTIFLLFSLCACTGEEKILEESNTIQYADGTRESIVFEEIDDAYANRRREYNEKYAGAILFGGGTITAIYTSVAVSQGNVPIEWEKEIFLDDGTRIHYRVKDPEVDLYVGDEVLFNGRVTTANDFRVYVDIGCWYKDGFVRRSK